MSDDNPYSANPSPASESPATSPAGKRVSGFAIAAIVVASLISACFAFFGTCLGVVVVSDGLFRITGDMEVIAVFGVSFIVATATAVVVAKLLIRLTR
ncbi:MAG: hypothetical protein KDA85_06915 [Planctomycetaceae bacterium]|nr:hypothetical protein [Planctomycetaceae bacterium]